MPMLYKDEEKGLMLFLQKNRCKGCEICIYICPRNILEKSEERNIAGHNPPSLISDGKCTFCHMCEYCCPDFSIYVTEINEGED